MKPWFQGAGSRIGDESLDLLDGECAGVNVPDHQQQLLVRPYVLVKSGSMVGENDGSMEFSMVWPRNVLETLGNPWPFASWWLAIKSLDFCEIFGCFSRRGALDRLVEKVINVEV